MLSQILNRKIDRFVLAAALIASLGAGVAWAAERNRETVQSHNKAVVLAFYDAGLNRKDFAVASQYLGPRYIQHNPTAADGAEGFKAFLAFLQTTYPQSHDEIKQVFVDGDFVILHVLEKLHPQDRGNAIVDIFRLEQGRIVEHWDVIQAVPDHANNPNTMF